MAVEPSLMLSLSSGDAELPLGNQQDVGEALIDLEQADVIDAEVGGLQGLAASVQDAGELQPGQADRGRDDSHVPKRGRHADLHLAVQSYSL
jgi:hypothetical protein